MVKYCCEMMKTNTENHCDRHDNSFDCPDCLIHYDDKFDEYGIIIHDGSRSCITINFCPWCGKKLPDSKRDEWFDKLEDLGYENPLFDENIPNEYKDSTWWDKNI